MALVALVVSLLAAALGVAVLAVSASALRRPAGVRPPEPDGEELVYGSF